MNTPAHLIFGLTAFGAPDRRAVTAAVLAGAVLPDLSLYVLSIWHLQVLGTSPEVVFGQLYYSEGWQAIFRIDNSFVIWGLGFGLAVMARSPVFIGFCGAGLLHLALDFPLHNDDARAHFWPVTNWKFISPVSYWDPRHYGNVMGVIEVSAAFLAGIWLWRRFKGWIMRAFIALLLLVQIAPVIIFSLMFS